MSRKDCILDAIQRLPADAGFDEAVEEIRILQGIEEGERDADAGRVQPHEDVRNLIRKWSSK